jgi:hypothetical protein
MHNQTRKLGVVYAEGIFDPELFDNTLAKYRVKIDPSSRITYPASQVSSATRPPRKTARQ